MTQQNNISIALPVTEMSLSGGHNELHILIRECIAHSRSAQKALYDQYSFQGAFEGWVRRIVVNTVTDHLRKNMKNDQVVKEVQPDDAFVNSDSVENISHKELLKIVDTLPETQRTVFNLFVFENYSHKEIATLLGLNENNSRWHLNDARRRLKEKISNILQ